MKRRRKQGSAAVTFRRFSRGGWAVFASLGRTVRIGVLTVGMLGSVCIEKVDAKRITSPGTDAATGDDASGTERELTEVTVAGSLAPLTQLQAARIVGVIGRQEIEASAAHTVNDLLKLASGVDVRQRGGFGIQTDISIDGGTFDQITILLNGVNISNPHTGHLAADFPVSLSDIERIEVLEGAASRVYGAAAFGGAINIVTRGLAAPDTTSTSTSASAPGGRRRSWSLEAGGHGGSYATFGGDGRASFSAASDAASAGGVSVSGGYQRSDGATANSDFRRGNVFARGQWRMGTLQVDAQGGWSRKRYGANTFYSAAYPDQWEANDRWLVSVGATVTGRVRVRPEIYWNRSLDHFQLVRNKPTGENHHRTDVAGSRVALDVAWVAGHTAIGGEVRTEQVYSTSLGHPIGSAASQPRIPGGQGNYTRHDRRTNLSLNVEHNIMLERLTLSAGVMAFASVAAHGSGSGVRFYPGVDVAWRPAAGWKVFASYNKGFRLPTFTDLYYKAPTHEGNSGLRAEESHSFQAGAAYTLRCPRVSLDATARAFYHRGTHMIDWVMYASDDVFHSANFDLDNAGAQAEARLRFTRPGAWVRSASVGYTYIHQHRRDATPVWKSNYSMEYLRHKLTATLGHRIWGALVADWTLRWHDRMGAYIRYEGAASTGELVPYSPYATLDVRLSWQQRHYRLWVDVTNVTNRTYYDLGNIPQPGIMVIGGVRVCL